MEKMVQGADVVEGRIDIGRDQSDEVVDVESSARPANLDRYGNYIYE